MPAGNKYYDHLPVWAGGNAYFNGARPWEKEQGAVVDTAEPIELSLEEREDGWYLKTNLCAILAEKKVGIISTEILGMAFEPEQKFENPDGTPIVFDRDYSGAHRGVLTVPGPFEQSEETEKKVF